MKASTLSIVFVKRAIVIVVIVVMCVCGVCTHLCNYMHVCAGARTFVHTYGDRIF